MLKFELIKESTHFNPYEESGQLSSRSMACNNNAACYNLQIENVEISPFELQSIPANREREYIC